jgi:alpha-1,2-mannosyltransferase
MGGLLGLLRGGEWLTPQRMRIWALCVFGISSLGVLYVILTSDGLNDFRGRPIGSDFSNVYAAGTYVLEGRAAAPFDWPLQFAREKAIFGAGTQFYGWHYPPFFLFVAGLLAMMPYALALAVWQGVTLLLYLFCIRTIMSSSLARPGEPIAHDFSRDPLIILLAIAFPAVLVNFGHGHNGFLTAALIGGGLRVLDKRPVVAGILFGLVSYKPQFGVLIPLVLIASGRWRTFAAATATVAGLILVTTLVFGTEVWRAFFDSMHLTRVEILEAGATGWEKIQSVFSWVRMWGGGVTLAYVVQGAVALAAAGALVWLWRSDAAFPLKAAALAIGAIIATPYSLDYDMMVLAPAIAFLTADGMSRGFIPWEKSALALVWFVPLFARSVAQYTFIPLGVWAMLAAFILVMWRANADTRIATR